jgi:hypothetical protein
VVWEDGGGNPASYPMLNDEILLGFVMALRQRLK